MFNGKSISRLTEKDKLTALWQAQKAYLQDNPAACWNDGPHAEEIAQLEAQQVRQ